MKCSLGNKNHIILHIALHLELFLTPLPTRGLCKVLMFVKYNRLADEDAY